MIRQVDGGGFGAFGELVVWGDRWIEEKLASLNEQLNDLDPLDPDGEGSERGPSQRDSTETACEKPDFETKLGIYVSFTIGLLTGHANLLAFNMPMHGEEYMTRGLGAGLKGVKFFNIPLAVGFEDTSRDGGFSWDRDWYWSTNSMSVSRDDGLTMEFGFGAGGSITHFENLVVPCAEGGRP
jgi:hypothetical protein